MKYLKLFEGFNWLKKSEDRFTSAHVIVLYPQIDECLLDLSDISIHKRSNLDLGGHISLSNGLVYMFFIAKKDQIELDDRIAEAESRIKEFNSKIRITTLTNKFSDNILGIIMLINNRKNSSENALFYELSREYVDHFPDGDMSNVYEDDEDDY